MTVGVGDPSFSALCRPSLRNHLQPREFRAILPAIDVEGLLLAVSFATLISRGESSLSPADFLPSLRRFESAPAGLVEAWARFLRTRDGDSVAEMMEVPRNCLLRGELTCDMPFTRKLLAGDVAAHSRGSLPAPFVARFFSSVGTLFEEDPAAISRAVAALSVFVENGSRGFITSSIDHFCRELCDETVVRRLTTLLDHVTAGDGVLVALLSLLGQLLRRGTVSDPLGGAHLPLRALWNRLSQLARDTSMKRPEETTALLRLAAALVPTTISCAPTRRFFFVSRALLESMLAAPREEALLAYVAVFRGFDVVGGCFAGM